jgi:two-component system, chemotaxis family, chemotaxis protein CheY
VTTLEHTPKRILVVDDEPTIRELIIDALRESAFQVEGAANGAEGLEITRRWLPHAIVLDLMMPRLDGTGFVQLMRLNPDLAAVPVLLVTAAYGAEQEAERMGARAFLPKPFELDRLVELVGELAGSPLPRTLPDDQQSVRGFLSGA